MRPNRRIRPTARRTARRRRRRFISSRLRSTTRAIVVVAASTFVATTGSARALAAAREPLAHTFANVVVAPDGTRVADVENDDPVVDGAEVHDSLVIRPVDGSRRTIVVLPCGTDVACKPSSPVWSPDGKRLTFVLRAPKTDARTIESVAADGTDRRTLLSFVGTLESVRYAPDGELAVLATAGAHKEIGATQAAAPIVGEIGVTADEQRIARVERGHLTWASPADLFVYEYAWRPDASGFVGTAATGNGDNNWWIAKLYAFDGRAAARVVYAPPDPKVQLANPTVSPDGTRVAFIGGIMSDFGSTGGDAYVLPLAPSATLATLATPTNLTERAPYSVTSLAWTHLAGTDRLLGATFAGTHSALVDVVSHRIVWTGDETLSARDGAVSIAADGMTSATVRDSFAHAAEIVAGPLGAWTPITHDNDALASEVRATPVDWTNDGYAVSGWLLEPLHARVAKRPMVTFVHGGPSAAYRNRFVGRGDTRDLIRAGDDVFLPNPRGSFGGGEAFARANVRDFGYGDLRDVLSGIDAAERLAPVDDARLGIAGYSYGGYMTMWTVTQTHRFKAAVAGAGVSDWLSYYGENGIDEWMIPFFSASVYDDPAVYARSSPITFVKNVTTPTFEYVGERDVECPMPQTQEFWHALETLGVPTQFVVYAGEGHGLRGTEHRADARRRTLAWFAKYLR